MNKPYRFVEKSKGESMEITQGKKEKVKNDKISQIIKFHECSDFSHTRAECSNFWKFKNKAMNAILSDEFNSEDSDDFPNKGENYLAFITSIW